MEKLTIKQLEQKLKPQFDRVDDIAYINQRRVLDAFKECKVSATHFAGSTGYGSGDVGRDNLAKVYAKVFGTESAIVSPLITSGSHAIATALFGLLRPGDLMLSVTGAPYDTLHDTIFGKDNGSLEEFKVKYQQIELKNGQIDIEKAIKIIKAKNPKVVFFQRSRGYTSRSAFSVDTLENAMRAFKPHMKKNMYFVVDNCYGEFTETREPSLADAIVGSLIKNIGGGLAPTGGYIAGSAEAIDKIATRFTSPSIKTENGSYESGYRLFYQGLFLAPHTVAQSIKGAYLVGEVMQNKGYKVIPSSDENACDIIKSIVFNTEDELIKFVQTVQTLSPVDSTAIPMPWEMPGYADKVIMAAGTFVGGASIELSCDSPIKKPYIAYFQGGLTYEHVKILADELNKLY